MVSSFADAAPRREGLGRQELIVSHELFLNDTARRFADSSSRAPSWLEEIGCKSTNTHLYLMAKVLEPPGETRPPGWVLRSSPGASRCRLLPVGGPRRAPWTRCSIIPRRATPRWRRCARRRDPRAADLARRLSRSRVRHAVGKGGALLGAREGLGLPPRCPCGRRRGVLLPARPRAGADPAHFHGFYDHGRALPSLAAPEPEPPCGSRPRTAAREVADGAAIRIFNERGEMSARAQVTDRFPAGTVWMRDGWEGINRLTSGRAVCRRGGRRVPLLGGPVRVRRGGGGSAPADDDRAVCLRAAQPRREPARRRRATASRSLCFEAPASQACDLSVELWPGPVRSGWPLSLSGARGSGARDARRGRPRGRLTSP